MEWNTATYTLKGEGGGGHTEKKMSSNYNWCVETIWKCLAEQKTMS